MTPLEEQLHLLSLFRQLGAEGRIGLVQRMRDEALRRIGAHWPRGGDHRNNDDCVTAALWIEFGTKPAEVKAAARLLRACVHAAEAPDAMDPARLVAIYAALDEPAVARDAAMQGFRRAGGKAKAAKLPGADELRAEVDRLKAARGMTEAEAKGVLRLRHGVTPQALNRKLKKANLA